MEGTGAPVRLSVQCDRDSPHERHSLCLPRNGRVAAYHLLAANCITCLWPQSPSSRPPLHARKWSHHPLLVQLWGFRRKLKTPCPRPGKSRCSVNVSIIVLRTVQVGWTLVTGRGMTDNVRKTQTSSSGASKQVENKQPTWGTPSAGCCLRASDTWSHWSLTTKDSEACELTGPQPRAGVKSGLPHPWTSCCTHHPPCFSRPQGHGLVSAGGQHSLDGLRRALDLRIWLSMVSHFPSFIYVALVFPSELSAPVF